MALSEINLPAPGLKCKTYTTGLRRNGVALIVNQRVWNAVLGCNLRNDRMISVHFQGKSFNITVILGEGNGTPLQYSCLENPMDAGAWKATIHGVAEGQTWLSDFTFTFHFHALEKEMATHSSVLAWRIPGTGHPGGLPSVESHRIGHDWSDSAAEERF